MSAPPSSAPSSGPAAARTGLRFAIVGAGATGGFLGARLARAGEDVVLIARGAHLAAMREHGIKVISADGDFVAHPACTDDLAVAGQADVIFLTVKAHSLPEIAVQLGPLLAPHTAVVTAQNGIPWWYFSHYSGPLAGTQLRSVDPDGVIARSFESRRVLGCVVYPATRIVSPGVVEHLEGLRFSVAELDDSRSERREAIVAALGRAGLRASSRLRIRDELWLKLLGNVAFNPLSALTRATIVDIATQPQTRQVAEAIMHEALSVARALGVTLDFTVEQRLEGAARVGAHETSMLQDVETGRPLEVEALVGAVVELADRLDLPVPHTRTVYACTRLLDHTLRQRAPRR
ncbi:MAG TPA: 2-dehydropantoate 2-reductase [Chloroflexota bacterium]|nr:2-dehydropantoate 2-reductase [Chloroflexota bacterium]